MTTHSPHFPRFEQLPRTIPVFPLGGALLLPRGLLPLNIFEPRYIAMVDDALASDRIIGMIQPHTQGAPGAVAGVHRIGCAGRITAFKETEDGRYLITLSGLCRFTAGGEIPTTRGYRRFGIDWSDFAHDLEPAQEDGIGTYLNRDRLRPALARYFEVNGIDANWEAIDTTPDDRLVITLSMICPFEPLEKQALLEAADQRGRAEAMIGLIEIGAALSGGETGGSKH